MCTRWGTAVPQRHPARAHRRRRRACCGRWAWPPSSTCAPPRELERTGRGPSAPSPSPSATSRSSRTTGRRARPMAAPAPAGDDLAERYLWYLDVGRQSLVDALDLLAEPASLPLVFHCAAGKDRTGVLAALVLDILGVDRRGHRGRLRDHRRPDGADPGPLPVRPGLRRADGPGAAVPVRRGGETMVGSSPSSTTASAGPGPGPWPPGWRPEAARPDGGTAARAGRREPASAPTRRRPPARPANGAGLHWGGDRSLWEPLLVGTLVVVTAVHGRVRGGGFLRLALRPPQVACLPLARRGGRGRGPVGGHVRRVDTGAGRPWSPERRLPVDAAPGPQGAVARGRPGRCRGAGGRRGRRAHGFAARCAGGSTRRPSTSTRCCGSSGRRPVPAEVAAQVIEVMQAAADVQRAAVASASDANGQRVRDLVRDADHEIQCLDAGLASAQAVLPPPSRPS